jgi:hypothetical protein
MPQLCMILSIFMPMLYQMLSTKVVTVMWYTMGLMLPRIMTSMQVTSGGTMAMSSGSVYGRVILCCLRTPKQLIHYLYRLN